jgi:hypothetical protein
MNINRSLFAILVIVLCSCAGWPLGAKSVSFESRFVSPDGRYSVDLVIIDKQPHFRITDTKTGDVDDSIVMPTLILYLHWASNSQSFVTVEHTAEGSYGRLVYLKGDKWRSLEVGPPADSMMSFSVINLQIKQDRVHFTFCVDYEKGNGIPVYYTFYDVDVELGTGKVLNTTWSPISHAEWLASLKRQAAYIPAMTKR